MSQRSKIELYNILKSQGGLSAFDQGPYIRITVAKPIIPRWDAPFSADGLAKFDRDDIHFELQISRLGDERWAYVLSGGAVIGQPFEWADEHTLLDQPW